MVRNWFKSVGNVFPALHFEHLRNKKYGFIESLPFDDNRTPEVEQRILNDYFALLERTLDAVVPLLVQLYEEKQPVLTRLVGFSDKLRDRLAEEFLFDDGWLIANSLRDLKIHGMVRVHHSEWGGAISLALEAGDPFATNFYIGIRNCSRNLIHDEGIKEGVFRP